MNGRSRGFGIALLLASVSCGPAVDKTAVAAVQVSGSKDVPSGCRLLGPLEGRDGNRWVPGGPRYETAMLDLRQKAVLGGGDRLLIDAIVPPHDDDYNPVFVVRARLFACGGAVTSTMSSASSASSMVPAAPPIAKVVAVPATRACEPECSPGYTCVRGACVSACNPPCGGNERCGTDRICHPIAAVPAPTAVAP